MARNRNHTDHIHRVIGDYATAIRRGCAIKLYQALAILVICSPAFAAEHARRVTVDTSSFSSNLSTADNTVQKALDRLDDMVSSASGWILTDDLTVASLQTLIDNAYTAGGGAILIAYGTQPISVTSTLTIRSNVAIVCDGAHNDHFKVPNGTGKEIINTAALTESSSRFSVVGCQFNGNRDNVTGVPQAISVSSPSVDIIHSDFLIANNRFHDVRVGGVQITRGTRGIISNNRLWNAGYTGLSGGSPIQCHGGLVDVERLCTYMIISENYVDNANGHGIHLKWEGANNNLVANNYVRNTTEDCILLGSEGSSNAATWGNKILNNHFSGCGNHGIDLYYSHNNLVSGNYLERTGATSSYYGIQVLGAKQNTIVDNIIENGASSSAIQLFAGTTFNNVIARNRIKTALNGITLDRGSSYNLVQDNYLEDVSASAIEVQRDAVHNFIGDNFIVDPKGSSETTRIFNVPNTSSGNLLTGNFWWKNADQTLGDVTYINAERNNYDLLLPSMSAVISGDATEFTGVAGDKINVTIDDVLYEDIDISSRTTLAGVASAINSAIGSTQYNAQINTNGYLTITSDKIGTDSNVTIADGTTTSNTVVGRLFSTEGIRTQTAVKGYRETNIEQRIKNDLLIDGFKMATDAADGYVLTSDTDGVGTWQAATGGGETNWDNMPLITTSGVNWDDFDLEQADGYNNTNWDTAYGWGNHADAGYATGTPDKITEGNTEAEVVDTGSDGHFKITTEGTERLRVLANGYVGIGTSDPQRPLHVSSADLLVRFDRRSSVAGSGFLITRLNTTTSAVEKSWVLGMTGFGGAALDDFSIIDYGTNTTGTGGTHRFVINKTSGNVGIGTSSPSAKLHTLATTEQLRLGYDTSNYVSTTVGSTGGVTFDAVGSGASFTFSDPVSASALTLPNGTTLPATCTVGQIFHDTDSDDCANTGSGDGALCICKATNTWALISNF